VLEIADRLATHAGVIRGGRMLDQGPVRELMERYDSPSLEAVFEKLIAVPAARNAKLSFYGDVPPAEAGARRGAA
jgi:ABC-2 type transport system ATP-binding protein